MATRFYDVTAVPEVSTAALRKMKAGDKKAFNFGNWTAANVQLAAKRANGAMKVKTHHQLRTISDFKFHEWLIVECIEPMEKGAKRGRKPKALD